MRIIMKAIEWPRGPVFLLSLSILLFAIPVQWEGPFLFNISEGNGLSLLDTLALVPLLISAGWIQKGLWGRRIYLFNKITMYPGSASLLIFFITIFFYFFTLFTNRIFFMVFFLIIRISIH